MNKMIYPNYQSHARHAPEWISHRGYKEAATENTEAAFNAAVALGFCVLETDLHASIDGQLVLSHDPDFKRLTGDSRPIATLTSSDIGRLRFADGSQPYFFHEFIEKFANQSWVFDIKPTTATKTIELLAKWAGLRGCRDEFMTKSRFVIWRTHDEAQLRELFPAARCFAQEKECYRAGLSVLSGLSFLGGIKRGRTYSLTPKLGAIDLFRPEIVEAYHRRGAEVLAFLPDSEDSSRRAVAAGFDMILTNGKIVGPNIAGN